MTRVRLTPLGGVGRFGRNCLCVEVEGGDAILVDCGVRFVSDEYPGFDVGLPDLERVAALGDRLRGIVVTHGHEDHIGGIPYVERAVPIFATPFTAKLIARRFERMGRDAPTIDVIELTAELTQADRAPKRFGAETLAGSVEPVSVSEPNLLGAHRQIGAQFRVTWLAVSHSIPDASCVVIDTPAGRIVHSGDFRVDDDPVLGPKTDLDGLARAGDEGIALLLADSTGAPLPGRNPGERSVAEPLSDAIANATGRVFIALFASHVQRLALIAQSCRDHGRKLCLLGTGLKETVRAARDLRLLDVDDVLVSESDARQLARRKIAYAVTGSQGERGSALYRLAVGEHGDADVESGDRVVISARVIPGNEKRTLELVEALAERGAEIVDGSRSPHVSGHGYSGDLELLLAATRPRAFAALHGNARHLLAHADLARAAGLDKDRVVDLRDGATLVLDGDTGALEHRPGVRAHEPLAVDGLVTMFPADVIRARRRMAHGGVLVVDAGAAGPRLTWRGVAADLPADLVRAVAGEAAHALAVAGTEEEPAALKQIARIFWRARRVPPEIVIVR